MAHHDVALGRGGAEVDDPEAAAALIKTLESWHNQVPYTGTNVLSAVAFYCGGLARVLGRYTDGEVYFAEASAMHQELSAPFDIARTNLEWARLLIERRSPGDLERARAQLREALRLARKFGYAIVERRADALLAGVS
jgi:hypothetical protein